MPNAGTHTIVATATMSTGEVASDTIAVSVLPVVVDDVAKAEASVAGTVTGSYLDTHADGAGAEEGRRREPPERHRSLSGLARDRSRRCDFEPVIASRPASEHTRRSSRSPQSLVIPRLNPV